MPVSLSIGLLFAWGVGRCEFAGDSLTSQFAQSKTEANKVRRFSSKLPFGVNHAKTRFIVSFGCGNSVCARSERTEGNRIHSAYGKTDRQSSGAGAKRDEFGFRTLGDESGFFRNATFFHSAIETGRRQAEWRF